MNLRIITTSAAAAILAASLSACAGMPGVGGSNTAGMQDLFKEILTSPNCGHDDKISVVTGAAGIPGSVTASAERHCPAPLAVGAVVAPAAP